MCEAHRMRERCIHIKYLILLIGYIFLLWQFQQYGKFAYATRHKFKCLFIHNILPYYNIIQIICPAFIA